MDELGCNGATTVGVSGSAIRQVTDPAFQEVDKNLLKIIYEQVFSIPLNHKCGACLHDAYWLLKIEMKKRTAKNAPVEPGTKYRIINPDFTIHTAQWGQLNAANIKDYQIEALLHSNKGYAKYFEAL